LYSINNKNDEKYNLETFNSASEAIKRFIDASKINKNFYDLIIIDIKMPDISGLQLYQLIRIIDIDVEVLFISALDTAEEFEGVLPGITSKNILKKPFQGEYFVSKIKEKLK
jgi:DNA-binding response OmpR family regulator